MDRSTETTALDREAPFRLGTEHRFPLDLTSSEPAVWDAYERALTEAWDPEDAALWEGFAPTELDPEVRSAGALVWSHRAWVEFPTIAESEAVLIRACLEPGIDVDFKYCLSMRAVERARSTDLSHLLAHRLAGYQPGPVGDTLQPLLDGELVRRALHEDTDLDAYVAGHLIAQGTIDLRLWERTASNCSAPLAGLVRLVTRDKARTLEVAWAHLRSSQAGGRGLDPAIIAETVQDILEHEEFRGRQVPALLAPGPDRDSLLAAHESAAAGLGGLTETEQLDVFSAALAETTQRLAELGVEIRYSEPPHR